MKYQQTALRPVGDGQSITTGASDAAAGFSLANGIPPDQASRVVAVWVYATADAWIDFNRPAAATTGVFIKGTAAPVVFTAANTDIIHAIQDAGAGAVKIKALAEDTP